MQKRCIQLILLINFNAINIAFNQSNVNSLECASMNNQECRTRTKIINTNNNDDKKD